MEEGRAGIPPGGLCGRSFSIAVSYRSASGASSPWLSYRQGAPVPCPACDVVPLSLAAAARSKAECTQKAGDAWYAAGCDKLTLLVTPASDAEEGRLATWAASLQRAGSA